MPKILYLNERGEEVPSTTTIIGKYKDMSGLMHFAWSEGKAGRGLNESRDRAGDVGSMLHGMIESYLNPNGKWILPTDNRLDALELARCLFQVFMRWWESNTLEVVATETSLVSEEHQYGGTLDLVARSPLGFVLLDWKTSSQFYQEMMLQMAAYRHLWAMASGASDPIAGASLVLFSKTSKSLKVYPVTEEQMDLAFKKFLLLRKTYDMEAAIAASVKEIRRAARSYDYDN